MARGGAFHDADEAVAFAKELAAAGLGVVVKADGLRAGKGVTVCESLAEAERAIGELAAGAGVGTTGERPWVVVEERLTGREASLIAICDGRDAVPLPMARDHKRLLDGDRGPNTGGMGAYSPLPDLSDEAAQPLLTAFHRPILAELARRGTPFRGALYAGLMLTEDGPVVLEVQRAVRRRRSRPMLRGWLCARSVLLAAARGDRARGRRVRADGVRLPTLPGAAVAIVPPAPATRTAAVGRPRSRVSSRGGHGALVFHSGTDRRRHGR